MNFQPQSISKPKRALPVSLTISKTTLIALLILFLSAIALGISRLQLTTEEAAYWNAKSEQCQLLMKELHGKRAGYAFWSHDGQDYYTFRNHFINLPRKGFYLDIAAGQPIYASTTYFYDHCLGWKGLCIEANPRHHDKFHGVRTCELIPRCVGSKQNKTVQFHDDDGGSGVVDSTYNNMARGGNVTTMLCTTVSTMLEERGIKHIDYLSLDVEGHELQVLKGINLRKNRVNVITVEIQRKDGGVMYDMIHNFMRAEGYKKHELQSGENTEAYPHLFPQDSMFIHKSVSFRSPK